MKEIEVGDMVIIRFEFSENQTFTYRGILNNITDFNYVIDDIKIGEIILKKSKVLIISRYSNNE